MIDDDDVWFAALAWPYGRLAVLGLIVVAFFALVAWQNSKDCERQRCDHGKPMVVDGKCVCIEAAR